ncbi:hypothetical protein AB0F13_24050 [Streptomyces sp. NPDC026206]|uniref:helix-turn-helix transcriptional regulator n=1 Tax=Streptomyces sp. NPDC026206 TaxID=3157089 RepID=UPI0033DA975B
MLMLSTYSPCENTAALRDAPRPGSERPDGTADQMERALLCARELIDSTVSMYRRMPGRNPLVVKADDEAAVENVVDVLFARARHSLSLALPGNAGNAALGAAALARLRGARHPSVTTRLLCTPRGLMAPTVAPVRKLSPRLETRVTESVLREVLIADGRTALIRSHRGPADDHVVIVEDPAAARALDLLFAGVWSGALHPVDHAWMNERLNSDVTRRILEHLRDGSTDGVAAREVQVSLRTYRRRVAEIMRELGANSRFQAGVRAVELGLLSAGG